MLLYSDIRWHKVTPCVSVEKYTQILCYFGKGAKAAADLIIIITFLLQCLSVAVQLKNAAFIAWTLPAAVEDEDD